MGWRLENERLSTLANKMKEVFTYKEYNSWISYVITKDNIVCLSAHTDKCKYGFKMLKALYNTFNIFNEVVTILPNKSLVDFYSKHYNISLINEDKQIYLISKKD